MTFKTMLSYKVFWNAVYTILRLSHTCLLIRASFLIILSCTVVINIGLNTLILKYIWIYLKKKYPSLTWKIRLKSYWRRTWRIFVEAFFMARVIECFYLSKKEFPSVVHWIYIMEEKMYNEERRENTWNLYANSRGLAQPMHLYSPVMICEQ